MNVKDPTIGIDLSIPRQLWKKVKATVLAVPLVKRFLDSRWAYYTGRNFQLLAAALKFVTFAMLIDIWHSHKWIVNTFVSKDFIITRDLFLNDCAYTRKGNHLTFCYNSDTRLSYAGFEFGRIHGHGLDSLEDPPASLQLASPIFQFLLVLSMIDLIAGFVSVFMKDLIVPKNEIQSNGKTGLHKCAHLHALFTANTFMICVLYVIMGFIIDNNKHSGLAQPTDYGHDTIGPTVVAFITATILFVFGVVSTILAMCFFVYENTVHPDGVLKTKKVCDV